MHRTCIFCLWFCFSCSSFVSSRCCASFGSCMFSLPNSTTTTSCSKPPQLASSPPTPPKKQERKHRNESGRNAVSGVWIVNLSLVDQQSCRCFCVCMRLQCCWFTETLWRLCLFTLWKLQESQSCDFWKRKKKYFLCVVYPQLFRNPLNIFISYSNVCFISVYRPLMYDWQLQWFTT